MGKVTKITVGLLLTFIVAATSVFAQGKLINSYRKWDAMRASDKGFEMCYTISTPTKWRASKKGARRGDIYFTVTSRPRFKIKDQVNAIVGYTLRSGSEVSITIDGKHRFKLFTEGGGAWAYAPRDDSRLVAAMKAGSTMVVTGTSSRGTRTTDTYSLSGFTAASNAVNKRCK